MLDCVLEKLMRRKFSSCFGSHISARSAGNGVLDIIIMACFSVLGF
jgi:hypothetical protein